MSEKQTIFKHAATILIGQFSSVAFGVVDTIIAGRNSPHDLAVLSVSNAVYVTVYVSLIGAIQALMPMFAEMKGAKKFSVIGDLFQQSLYMWLLLFLPGCLVLLYPTAIFTRTRVASDVTDDVRLYLMQLSKLLPASLFFRLFGALNQSIGNPRIVTWIQVGGLVLKIPLTILLFRGTSRISSLGISGCAISTTWITHGMCIFSVYLLWSRPNYAELELWKPMAKPDRAILKRMAHLAVPNFLSNLVEITSFSLMSLFVSRMGVIESGSHQIAANMTSLLFMVPLSISIATSARLSYWIGAVNHSEMKNVLRIGFTFVCIESLFFAFILLFFPEFITQFYAKSPEVKAMAASLLVIVGLFHIGDSVQTLCIFVLRCLKITFVPFLVYSSLLWGVGIGGGYLLAFKGFGKNEPIESPRAFWMTSVAALFFASPALAKIIQNEIIKRETEQEIPIQL